MPQGTVQEFDAHAGVGVIEDSKGWRLPFHCTALVDGSRTIDVGAAVEFEVEPGHLGRWEASAISRV